MYTLTQYNKAHAAACKRIGLNVGKALGTTPHGHRHAYGQRLKRAGIEKPLIRRFMHHSSIESQEIYTQPSTRDARIALEAAALRLRGDQPEFLSQFGPFV
ncbi:tyrosine-type recombinase/integrase [Paraburkholderia domus]|uniref:tyrosine-type recombinase/integrase n=1 Tax=Paraburkholderia domus TaxID=2793075 RepID=UPI001EF0DDF6|nr:tyrosine-type recombinase/integrase [Paraburkholderia domus]